MKTEDKLHELSEGTPDKLKDAAKTFEQLRDAEKQALDNLISVHAKCQRPLLERAFKDMHKLQDVAMIQFMEILRDEIRDRDERQDKAMEKLCGEIRDLSGRLATASLFISEFSPVLVSVRTLVDAKKDFLENGIDKLRQIGCAYADFFKLANANGNQYHCDALRSVEEHTSWHNARTGELTMFLKDVFDIIDDLAILYNFPTDNLSKEDVTNCFNNLQRLRESDAEFHPGYKDYDDRKFKPWLDKCKQWYRDDAHWIREAFWQIPVDNNQGLQDAKDCIVSNIDQHLDSALDSLQAFRDALNNLLTLAEAYNPATE